MDPMRNSQSNQFNWGKMLNEDLDDMMKKKMDKANEDLV
jgi:hypothetical protein